ncbi:MAG: peptidoglycan-binding protein [Terrimicrobiaceae bacterium]|nr:peptidoglycan-binding protein [Terrimicrobiaceae bacterium]
MSRPKSAEIQVPMAIDVDGAPNSYGPDDRLALDYELNAHVGASKAGKIVGYLTKNDDGRTPIVQGPDDPFPGFYISTTGYADKNNPRPADPRRYVNAAEINYTLLAKAARDAGVKLGDFCVVHSLRTRLTVYAIVGDSGNSSGAEGSLALLQRLGYAVTNGKSGGEDARNIVVRYFAGTNPERRFFFSQAELEAAARPLDLDADFTSFHPGDPGTLVLAAIAASAPVTAGAVSGAASLVERVLPFVPLRRNETALAYPNHLIRLDSADTAAVRLIQQRLRNLGYTERTDAGAVVPLNVDGGFGSNTADAVELFQMRHTTLNGDPLEVDGIVGSETWGALFGRDTVHASPAAPDEPLLAKVLEVAAGEIGTMEKPPGSNRGERVEMYQRGVGIGPGDPWCAAFVYYCFATAAKSLGAKNPLLEKACRTGCVLTLWNLARANGVPTITRDEALDDPSRVKPGMIFILSTGGGQGHTGLVARVSGNRVETIEGNTNDGGSREGIGVFRRTGRSVASINRGYIAFASG